VGRRGWNGHRPRIDCPPLARNTDNGAVSALSPHEREVLGLMAEGRPNAVIAQRLVISERAPWPSTRPPSSSGSASNPSEEDNRRVLAGLAYLGT
jgi:hypothetical protein